MKSGYGVVMVRKPNGHWSLPVLVSANEASLGFQVGAKSIETVCVFTDDTTPRMLFTSRYNIGVDAKAVIGPKAAEYENDAKKIFVAPVLVYTKSNGLYAGATVKAGQVIRNDPDNFTLYSTTYRMPELLYSDWVAAPDDVRHLIDFVQQVAP